MKLIWRIFLKDLRRLAWPLVLWAGFIALQFVVHRYFKALLNDESATRGKAPEVVLSILQIVVVWLFVPTLIHEDPLLDDRAVWRTRPISGARLLGAKLLGLAAMFWLWPSLLTLPWWLELGFGPGEIVHVVAMNMVVMAGITLFALAIAALTDGLLRYLGWSLVFVVAIGLDVITVSGAVPGAEGEAGKLAVLHTRVEGASLLLVVGAMGVVLVQFLSRKLRLAVGIAVVSLAIAGIFAWMWPWSAAEMRAKTGLARFALPTSEARLAHATLFVPPSGRGRAELRLTFEHATSGLREGEAIAWQTYEGVLRHGDKGRLPLSLALWPGWQPTETEGNDPVRAVRRTFSMAEVSLPAAMVPRLRNGDVSLHSGRIAGGLRAERTTIDLPLQVGRGGGKGREHVHVTGLNLRLPSRPGQAEVDWLDIRPLVPFENLLRAMDIGAANRWKRREFAAGAETRTAELDGVGDESFATVGALMMLGRRAIYSPSLVSVDQAGKPAADTRFIETINWETAPVVTAVGTEVLRPDVIVEGSLDVALARAKAEGKRVLVLSRRAASESNWDTYGWGDPRVRELLRTRFVCVAVFASEDPRFAKRFPKDSEAKAFVVTSDGAVQDAIFNGELAWSNERWLTMLRANASGATYAAALREEKARKTENDWSLRRRFFYALLARGDFDEALTELLAMQDDVFIAAAREDPARVAGVYPQLIELGTEVDSVRATLRRRHVQAVEQLRRDPRDVAAARMLYVATLAMHDQQAWNDLPRLLPPENPIHWGVLVGWLRRSNSPAAFPVPPDALDWEAFFAEGIVWLRERVALAQQQKPENYQELIYDRRTQLLRVGVKGVSVLAAAGRNAAAQRLAEAVQTVHRSQRMTEILARALSGQGNRDVWSEYYGPMPPP